MNSQLEFVRIDVDVYHAVCDRHSICFIHQSSVWNDKWRAMTWKKRETIDEDMNRGKLWQRLRVWHAAEVAKGTDFENQ